MVIDDIENTITNSIASGSIDRATHDRIMITIQADGKIDEREKELLSLLFRSIQSGQIKLTDPDEANIPKSKRDLKKVNLLIEDALARSNETKITYQKEESAQLQVLPTENHAFNAIPVNTNIQVELPQQSDAATLLESSFGIAHTRRDRGKSFMLRNDRILDINLNGMAWIKTGSMVGYFGSMKFTREGMVEHGVAKTLKKALTGEGTALTKATGSGNLFLADQGKKISLVNLGAYSLVVNGSNLLAFEQSINWDITWLRQLAAFAKGGMFNVRLNGNGMAAITSNGDPMMLKVSPNDPVMTDMNATVAWSGSLAPQFKTDISAGTLIGRAGGESIQMRFEGEGFVIIQPFEEALRPAD